VSVLVAPGDSRNEVVLRLHHVGRLDGEQELAARNDVTRLGEEPDESARVRGKHHRRAVFIDRDLSFGHLLITKHPFC